MLPKINLDDHPLMVLGPAKELRNVGRFGHRKANLLMGVGRELQRQIKKHGVTFHDDATWLMILTEELGEVAREVLERRGQSSSVNLRVELTQVAAVAVAWLETARARAVQQKRSNRKERVRR